MDVRVVVGEVAVLALANDVGHPTQSQNIDFLFQIHPFIERDPLARIDFLDDCTQLRIVCGCYHGRNPVRECLIH